MVFTRAFIDKCRKSCNQEYLIEEEEPEFIPPNDFLLGKSRSNPAVDCKDVVDNGPGKMSGTFYVRPQPQYRIMKVYCDNDSEEGGWTLEYSYHKLVDPLTEDNTIPEDIFEVATNFNPKEEKFAKK